MYKTGFGALKALDDAVEQLAVLFKGAAQVDGWCEVIRHIQKQVLHEHLLRMGWIEEVEEAEDDYREDVECCGGVCHEGLDERCLDAV